MRAPGHAKKVKNVKNDVIDGKRGMIYIPDQKISKLTLASEMKGLKRARRDAKKNKGHSKKQKLRKKKKLAHKNAKRRQVKAMTKVTHTS